MDPKEAELLEAKRLCDITQGKCYFYSFLFSYLFTEELRFKSTEDLRTLVSALMDYHQKMQEQANYWLDSKEQLIMDAEMHNKMIASLVQYAQQQQIAPKGIYFSIMMPIYYLI